MKEKIEKMYIQALIDDLPPNVFADQVLRLFDVSGMLPTDEELDNAAIDFINGHCDNLSGDLTQEAECFDAGAIWMRERLLGNYR